MTARPVLRVMEVHRSYRTLRGRSQALRGVSLTADSGRVVVLVGRNGAGKTTLLHVIAGFLRPERGRVQLSATGGGGVGWLAENDALPPSLSPHQLVLALCPEGASRRAAEAMLDELGLADLRRLRAGQLSRGQRRRVGLALALSVPGRLSLLDEPFAGVDPLEQERCRTAIRRAAGEGRAVVIATHLLGEVEGLADELVVLDRGSVLLSGAVDDLLTRHGSVTSLREMVVEILSSGGRDEPGD